MMKSLMHKIVAKPNLIADDALNGKIERMFNNPLFQRMVERAELIAASGPLPSGDARKQAEAEFIRKLAAEAQPVRNGDDELPHFGAEGEKKAADGAPPAAQPESAEKEDVKAAPEDEAPAPAEGNGDSFGADNSKTKDPAPATGSPKKYCE